MRKIDQQVWISQEDLTNDPALINQLDSERSDINISSLLEDDQTVGVQANRRDFLKLLGFGFTAATLASCETPIKKAIPYTVATDEIIPGIANYYASTFVNGGDVCPVLVKTREGRPIKIEGNSLSSMTQGGTSSRAQASVLSLYDISRLKNPGTISGDSITEMSWADLDATLGSKLNTGSRIRIVSSTIMSPSAKKTLREFTTQFPNTKHLMYDPISSAALLQATQNCFGIKAIPDYKFDQAETIVSFNADFLGTWISPVEYAAQFVKGRKVNPQNPKMNRLFQVESQMSLTGSNADHRILVKPSEQGSSIIALYNLIASKTGASSISGGEVNEKAKAMLSKASDMLIANKGKSLVVCGNNNLDQQVIVYGINQLLGNIGTTVNFNRVSYQRQGNETEINGLISEMSSGQVDVLIIWNANPCYDLPMANAFKDAMSKVSTRISLNYIMDETTTNCSHSAPVHHYLESWGDVEAKTGIFSLIQPTINPIFNTRQAEHSILTWCKSQKLDTKAEQPYYEYLKSSWKEMFPSLSWDETLHNGVYEVPSGNALNSNFNGNPASSASKINSTSNSGLELSFTESVNIGGGQYANNPWLQEIPDPISRCSWGNHVGIPITFDGDRRFIALENIETDGTIVNLVINGQNTGISSIRQFGQMQGTLSAALGYGRIQGGVCGTGIGVNLYPYLKTDENGFTQYYIDGIDLKNAQEGIEKSFACVQHHHTIGVTAIEKSSGSKINADEAALVDDFFKPIIKGYQGSLTDRSILRTSNLSNLKENLEHNKEKREEAQNLNSKSLYPGFDYNYNSGHHWGLHIDMNSCIGCSSCAVACMSENNVPVVGKHEVARHHEMTWLRIDRYYYGDVENPSVAYQPMMCQHCNSAPCENVCPVNATNHSSDGLNQMAYNRCVGTRYCANNCPYKVRRFNWYDYTESDLFPWNSRMMASEKDKPYYAENLVRMVLNPDVTVRSRGVIEKCSFCIQRIQEGKLNAKKENRQLHANEVKSACQTACPTGAITFGDMNNPESDLSKKLNNPLNYIVLEEIGVKSVVNYSMRVTNKDESIES
ncbi:MAG: 4Fe-4S dicluster domain-containing protein [Saprospiraceae bacterium]|nr:4Fe-4S dicluster domain-containing protein [Saprospiraceae bacterium]